MKNIKRMTVAILLIFTFGLFIQSEAKAQLIQTVVALTGNVFDAVSKSPVTATIKITDENGKRVNQTRSNAIENGSYYVTSLKPGKTYFVNISKEDYFEEKFKITLANTDKYEEISRDFLIKPKAKGVKIALPVPPFELNKSKLRYGAEDLLEGFQSTLVNNPDVKFEIVCYPDNDKDPKANQKLTEERCQSLKDYFTANGVEGMRFKVQASATTDPLKPPPTSKMAKGKRYIGTSYIVVTDY
ncbi:MAG: OmpA family protein [Ignavibacteriae bacterium]|nr:OmpA family protein [Ignavibacteriota bacterium]